MADLKRQLRKAVHHTEEDIQLLLIHMRRTGRMAVETFTGNSQGLKEGGTT